MPLDAVTPAAPAVAIVGPTGSGKSTVAMAVAAGAGGLVPEPPVEIVAVDAMQVYCGMDIGTATPSAADRRLVAHHGLDLVEPSDEMSVTEYRRHFDAAVAEIATRGHRALIVAGTGLYLTAVLDRLELPGSFPAVRAELDADPDTEALYHRLVELDPVAAARIEPGNRRRIVRALEVTVGSERPFSSFGPGVDAYPATPVVQIGIRWPRAALAQRIAERVDAMIAAGLVAEVARVRAAGMSRTAAQALGYKELVDVVDGTGALDDAVADIVVRTRQYAARQERWFRRDPRVRWVDVDPHAEHPLQPVVDAVSAALAT